MYRRVRVHPSKREYLKLEDDDGGNGQDQHGRVRDALERPNLAEAPMLDGVPHLDHGVGGDQPAGQAAAHLQKGLGWLGGLWVLRGVAVVGVWGEIPSGENLEGGVGAHVDP